MLFEPLNKYLFFLCIGSFYQLSWAITLSGRLVLWLQMRFTCNHSFYCLVIKKGHNFFGRTHPLWGCTASLQEAALWCFLCWEFTHEQWSHPFMRVCRRFTRSSSLLLLVLRIYPWIVEPCSTDHGFSSMNSGACLHCSGRTGLVQS
jgi:hypothetical protein